MSNLKTWLMFAGGVSLFIFGVILRGLFDRRGSGRAGPKPDSVRDHANGASTANRITGTAVDDSAGLNQDIREGNTTAQRLVSRSREILAAAKDRSSGTVG